MVAARGATALLRGDGELHACFGEAGGCPVAALEARGGPPAEAELGRFAIGAKEVVEVVLATRAITP